MAENCIFCRIIKGEVPCQKVYEDDDVIAFKDINPAAPVHVLVVPKKHIKSLEELDEENIGVVVPVHRAIQKVAEITGVEKDGYRVIVNTGPAAGQTVMHVHYHVLGGVNMGEKLR